MKRVEHDLLKSIENEADKVRLLVDLIHQKSIDLEYYKNMKSPNGGQKKYLTRRRNLVLARMIQDMYITYLAKIITL